jgi:hypothetical protein
MGIRFDLYKKRHKKAAARRNAEVVNGEVYYRNDAETGDAVREALKAGRYEFATCDRLPDHDTRNCGGGHYHVWDEEGNLISHPGNDDFTVKV